MTTTRITVKKVSDLSRKVACSKCNRNTNHKVLTQVEYYWDAGPGADIQGYDYYETISCLGCEDISFRLTSSNSEDVDEDENGNLIHTESEEMQSQINCAYTRKIDF